MYRWVRDAATSQGMSGASGATIDKKKKKKILSWSLKGECGHLTPWSWISLFHNCGKTSFSWLVVVMCHESFRKLQQGILPLKSSSRQ